MKRRIKRIAPLQAGKMLGALYDLFARWIGGIEVEVE